MFNVVLMQLSLLTKGHSTLDARQAVTVSSGWTRIGIFLFFITHAFLVVINELSNLSEGEGA